MRTKKNAASEFNEHEKTQSATRVAIIGIIVEDPTAVGELNAILHEYGSYIIGRMGLPYKEKNVNIISITLDAPQDVISALAGKVGRLNGVSSKAVYANV